MMRMWWCVDVVDTDLVAGGDLVVVVDRDKLRGGAAGSTATLRRGMDQELGGWLLERTEGMSFVWFCYEWLCLV